MIEKELGDRETTEHDVDGQRDEQADGRGGATALGLPEKVAEDLRPSGEAKCTVETGSASPRQRHRLDQFGARLSSHRLSALAFSCPCDRVSAEGGLGLF